MRIEICDWNQIRIQWIQIRNAALKRQFHGKRFWGHQFPFDWCFFINFLHVLKLFSSPARVILFSKLILFPITQCRASHYGNACTISPWLTWTFVWGKIKTHMSVTPPPLIICTLAMWLMIQLTADRIQLFMEDFFFFFTYSIYKKNITISTILLLCWSAWPANPIRLMLKISLVFSIPFTHRVGWYGRTF